MMTLRRQLDSLFDDSFFGLSGYQRPLLGRIWGLDLDVVENDESFLIHASVPGIDPEQLDITLENNVLTIKGELEEEERQEGDVYHLRERRYGQFSRSITLPSDVDAEAIEAHVVNGVLTLTVPKSEESKPKRIPIRTQKTLNGNGQKVIENQSS
jgi:HSP20 family protein